MSYGDELFDAFPIVIKTATIECISLVARVIQTMVTDIRTHCKEKKKERQLEKDSRLLHMQNLIEAKREAMQLRASQTRTQTHTTQPTRITVTAVEQLLQGLQESHPYLTTDLIDFYVTDETKEMLDTLKNARQPNALFDLTLDLDYVYAQLTALGDYLTEDDKLSETLCREYVQLSEDVPLQLVLQQTLQKLQEDADYFADTLGCRHLPGTNAQLHRIVNNVRMREAAIQQATSDPIPLTRMWEPK